MGNLLYGWSNGQHRDTKRNRYLDLHHFATFVLNEELPRPSERDDTRAATVVLGLLRAQPGHTALSEFLEWLNVCNYKPETKVRKLKTVRLWARYLYEKRAVPRHLEDFSIPSVACLESQEENASDDALPSMPREVDDAKHLSTEGRAKANQTLKARDQAIMNLLAHSTLDHVQLLGLNWEDVDFGQHPLHEDDALAPPVRVYVPRRDGHKYWRHLVPHATHTMRHWNRAYVSHFCAALPDRPVFCTLTGKRLSPARLYQITDG